MTQIPITGHTHLVTLLGCPVDHSGSPAIQNYTFEKNGIDSKYLALEATTETIGDIIKAMRALKGWDGANCTMPVKQAVIPHLDRLDIAAELIGAVNTIKREGDEIVGYCTDGAGFINNLRKHGVEPKGKVFALVGPGGAGSAIFIQAALEGAAKVNVLARKGGGSWKKVEAQLPELIEKTGCKIELHDMTDPEDFAATIAESDIVANATNVGMGEDCTDNPVPAELLHAGQAVADAIYLPRKTQMLKDAEAKGCTIVPGLGMLVEQGAVAAKIWYDIEMPVDEIIEKLF